MLSQKDEWVVEELVPIREKVYQYLKNEILKGELKTGERLVERELADKLKISRTPIREALLRLESQGFVTTVPRKGVIVSQISLEQVLEVFSILSSLEVLAVQLATERLDEFMTKELDELIEETNRLLAGNEDEEISQFHIRINNFLYKAAKSPRLYEMLSDLVDYIRAFAHIGYEVPGRMREALHEHKDILQAMSERQIDKAMKMTQDHIENSRKAYIRTIDSVKKK
ncbi:GntR family transcriptional regulator [Ammoniphilus sp. CFH 90114]|uniref:GntR family transcriptional regulator n=1 Tax=Ammoniphilus sp. CFH 90114 TaxID=2493665 RepID=UPI00100ECA22|nr:GntR family transcriptional regulator [Ammoniphilus sp. CFH 90114]RXT04850.1 GntR family transcriptional regulator [Ammoniphilus sp. CFH 90114]